MVGFSGDLILLIDMLFQHSRGIRSTIPAADGRKTRWLWLRLIPFSPVARSKTQRLKQESGRDAKQGQAWYTVRLFNNDLPRHRDERNFQDNTRVNDVFLHVCLQCLKQFHPDQHQQEISKDLEQALHRNETGVASRFLERSARPRAAWTTPRRGRALERVPIRQTSGCSSAAFPTHSPS